MEKIDYEVNRSDIYVGDVCVIDPTKLQLRPDGLTSFNLCKDLCFDESELKELYDHYENRPFLMGDNHLSYFFGGIYHDNQSIFQRTMLFVLDENKHANDLLYNSPSYPIINISSHDDIYHSKIVLLHYTYWIGKLLEHFGYPDKLQYADIVRIRKHLFSCDYALENCEIFGRQETARDDSGYEIFDSHGRHRTFNIELDDSPLHSSYFSCLCHNKDYFVEDDTREQIGFLQFKGEIVDAFKPGKLEGPVKVLRKQR